jgi:hypothetical protein
MVVAFGTARPPFLLSSSVLLAFDFSGYAPTTLPALGCVNKEELNQVDDDDDDAIPC